MYLKSLTLKGFKSFADKTVFTVEPGVTCVVGPNGSGKSNISDAVLWVLGEQKAKSLRGQNMEDVIFAGSSARQAVGVAEVDLVLDNSDGTIPLDFNEITITRRMYRSGESEYLINQSPSRLLDIRDLLHDSGLGRDAQSIISQGRLTEVLESKAEDRRALVEEAAGVLKHKKRKEKALRKLGGLDANLERATDIASEISRQLKPLERQAKRALEHAEYVKELHEVEVLLAVDDLRKLQKTWDTVSTHEREGEGEISILRYELEERERELEKYQHLLEEKGLFVGDITERRSRVQSVLERLESAQLLLGEKGKNLISRLSDLRSQLHGAESRIEKARASEKELTADRSETLASLQELYSQLGEARKENEIIRKERVDFDDELTKLNTSLRSDRGNLEESRNNVLKLSTKMSSLNAQSGILETRAKETEERYVSDQEALSEKRRSLDEIENKLNTHSRELALATNDVDKRVRVIENRRADLELARTRFSDAKAEVRGLEEVDRALKTASPAIAAILERKESFEGLLGSVADIISADAEYEALTEKLLGSDLFALICSDSSAALEIARVVRDEGLGEIALIPSDTKRESKAAPNVGIRLIDQLEYDDAAARAVEGLLGDIYVVDSLKSALAAAKKNKVRFCTPDGSVVWPNGKITVGVQISDSEGVLTRKRRYNNLQDQMKGLEAEVLNAELSLSQAEEALVLAQQDALGFNQKVAQVTGDRNALSSEIDRMEFALNRLAQEREGLLKQQSQVLKSLEAFAPELENLESRILAYEENIKLKSEQLAALEYDRKLKIDEETRANEKLSTINVKVATVTERETNLKRQLASIVHEIENLENTIITSYKIEKSLEILRSRIQPLHELYSELHQNASKWSILLRERASLEQSDSESLRSTIEGARTRVKEARAKLDDYSEKLTEIKLDKAQQEMRVNNAVTRIVEEIGMPLEHALELPFIENRMEVEDRAFALRKKISHLGTINPIAKEEFEALKARKDFMQSQIDDLFEARKSLHKVVAAIDRKIKTLFLETFEEVDAKYQELFAILFPGGTAQLLLTDPDDPDNTGVEFIAQPRGKALKKMSLLSGGERSLAAIALLFAVYSVRPVPFFILDEVEQALDDSNLRRFVAFINTMRKNTQFLIITHQRRTMEMADVLYGVSMQADGISKLVSQKLEQATQLVEG